MALLQSDPVPEARPRSILLAALVVAFAVASAKLLELLNYQPAGVDFSCFWAGAWTALHAPARLYDFEYVTNLQGWPLGPEKIRPFIYPPSSLFLFTPFALAPYWIAYALWVGLTGALFLWAGLKAKASWWLMLLPPVALVAICGQITLLIGGLALGGLALRNRPIAAGVLFGLAAAVKPQLMVLIPIALVAEGRLRTLLATGATGAVLVAASAAVWGVDAWVAWLNALPRFQAMIFHDASLVEDAITPFATLQTHGLNGAWAYLLAPLVAAGVWTTFRRNSDIADRSIAIFAGALLVSPYAMNYEAALLAPAVALYLARTEDPRWLAFAAASVLYAILPPAGLLAVLAVVALPLVRGRARQAYSVA
jgi:hypothetical protein